MTLLPEPSMAARRRTILVFSRRPDGTVERLTLDRYGFGEEAHEVQELYLAGKKTQAAQHLSADLIDATCICGPADHVAQRLKDYETAGVAELILLPTPTPGGSQLEQLERIAALRG